jgi:hypothetical protein
VRAFAFEPGSLDNDVALYVYPFDGVEIDRSASGDDLIAELPETACPVSGRKYKGSGSGMGSYFHEDDHGDACGV